MKQSLLFIFLFFGFTVSAQTPPYSLRPDISIRRLLTIKTNAVRIAYDKVSGCLYYNTAEGNIYRLIKKPNGSYADSLIYTATQHGIHYLMGMAFRDSCLYLSGNNGNYTPYTTGLIAKGKLTTSEIRNWTVVAKTDSYPTADRYDHLVSGLVINPKGDSVLICNGSRGDHGEIETRYGQFPGLRNVPLTTNVLCVPADTQNLVLKNDSLWLAQSGFLYVRGARNYFDMAYDASGNLFALENSCDRDHNEEMNWLRFGRHYGFPWVMGQTVNTMQYPGYDILADKMLPANSWGKSLGIFLNDSTFPPPPAGIVFEEPIENLGPDADHFRDSITGFIRDASDEGIGIKTFTAHRSPLGLVFDKDSLLQEPFTGQAFMLGYSKGIMDSTKILPPNNEGGPYLDPSEDLCHLALEYDQPTDKFKLHTTRIIGGFHSPVDAEITENKIYIIENQYDSLKKPSLWEITLPQKAKTKYSIHFYPNPALKQTNLSLLAKTPFIHIELYDMTGKKTRDLQFEVIPGIMNTLNISLTGLANGVYTCYVTNGDSMIIDRLLVFGN